MGGSLTGHGAVKGTVTSMALSEHACLVGQTQCRLSRMDETTGVPAKNRFVEPDGSPSGLKYMDDFLTPDEEFSLLAELAKLDWDGRGKIVRLGRVVRRRELDFIHAYERHSRKLGKAETLPAFLEPVRERCARALRVAPEGIGQIITALYCPGAGIDWHVDSTDAFGDIIGGVSLGSACHIDFSRDKNEVWRLKLLPRSLFVMEGPSRYEFQHRIRRVKDTRYSITLRTLSQKLLAVEGGCRP